MISTTLLELARCPDCGSRLTRQTGDPACTGCGRIFLAPKGEYLDLRPRAEFDETTKYLDGALHADARHEHVSPPLLGAGIRQDVLAAFLAPGPGDRVIDLGCGSGRGLVWNRASGAQIVGVDVSPFFAREAIEVGDLALADLRRLPFVDGAFSKAYALDVFEHLSRDALRNVLREAARVLAPGGSLFVYSHVRKNAPVAAGLRWVNTAARWLERRGLLDMAQERLRKSDHLNPLADIPQLRQVVGEAGFDIVRIRYYTPIVGGMIENLLVRVVEHWLSERARRRLPDADDSTARVAAIKSARTEAKARISKRGPTYWTLRGLTAAMKLDLWLFGRIESGPFFALLVKSR